MKASDRGTASGRNQSAIKQANKWGDSRFETHRTKDVVPAYALPRSIDTMLRVQKDHLRTNCTRANSTTGCCAYTHRSYLIYIYIYLKTQATHTFLLALQGQVSQQKTESEEGALSTPICSLPERLPPNRTDFQPERLGRVAPGCSANPENPKSTFKTHTKRRNFSQTSFKPFFYSCVSVLKIYLYFHGPLSWLTKRAQAEAMAGEMKSKNIWRKRLLVLREQPIRHLCMRGPSWHFASGHTPLLCLGAPTSGTSKRRLLYAGNMDENRQR